MHQETCPIKVTYCKLWIVLTVMFLLVFLRLDSTYAAGVGGDEKKSSRSQEGKGDEELCFAVVGDIGGQPKPPYQTFAQKKVANLLAKAVAENGCKFIVGVGDNFYFNGVKNVRDPRFYWTYERTYSHPSLAIPWYMIAGNHDHAANVSAQIAYSKISKRWKFPDFYYNKVFSIPNSEKTMELVMLDTTMLCHYNKKSNAPPPNVQWKWIDDTLKNSKAEYLVVAGHHPIFSSGSHGNTKCLVQRLKPLLEKYSVTAYFSGHDHNLQHIQEPDSQVHYFISGSGNFVDQRFNNRHNLPLGSSLFEFAENCGFNLVRVHPHQINLQTFTVDPPPTLLNPNNESVHDVIIKPRDVTTAGNGSERDDQQLNFMLINVSDKKTKGDKTDYRNSDKNNKLHSGKTVNLLKLSHSYGKQNEVSKNVGYKVLTKDSTSEGQEKTPTKTKSLVENDHNWYTTATTKNEKKPTINDNPNIQTSVLADNDNDKRAKHQQLASLPAIKLIDTSKITIDNLSDIPLSSYGNLMTNTARGKPITSTFADTKDSNLNKTGDSLKDFILERLPNARIANNKTTETASVTTSNITSTTSSNANTKTLRKENNKTMSIAQTDDRNTTNVNSRKANNTLMSSQIKLFSTNNTNTKSTKNQKSKKAELSTIAQPLESYLPSELLHSSSPLSLPFAGYAQYPNLGIRNGNFYYSGYPMPLALPGFHRLPQTFSPTVSAFTYWNRFPQQYPASTVSLVTQKSPYFFSAPYFATSGGTKFSAGEYKNSPSVVIGDKTNRGISPLSSIATTAVEEEHHNDDYRPHKETGAMLSHLEKKSSKNP